VQNLVSEPPGALVSLIRGCSAFPAATAAACYRWLGKTIAVVTDGAFARTGCPQLAGVAARECRAGALTMEQALVTFS
jgi:hypothetical protein